MVVKKTELEAGEKGEQETTKKIVRIEVPTQVASAYQFPDGTIVSTEDLLVWIANNVYEIKRVVG